MLMQSTALKPAPPQHQSSPAILGACGVRCHQHTPGLLPLACGISRFLTRRLHPLKPLQYLQLAWLLINSSVRNV